MRVLLAAKSFTKGGAATGIRNLRRALETVGIDVISVDGTVHARDARLRAIRGAERVLERVVFTPEVHCVRLGPPSVSLERVLEQYSPDIVQMGDVSGNTLSFEDLRRARVPVVHRMSDLWPYAGAHHYPDLSWTKSWRKVWADALLSKSVSVRGAGVDLLVAPSAWLAEEVRGHLEREVPIRIIRNAVAMPAYALPRTAPAAAVLRLGFISGKVLDPRKGFSRLGRTLERLGSADQEVSLEVFGDPSGAGIRQFGRVRVSYHGRFVPGDLERVFSSIDILMCPSVQDNSPNVVSEALAHGVPVIGQSGTGMASYIQPGRTGALVDFAALHDHQEHSLSEVLGDMRQRYASYSELAIEFVRSELSYSAIGDRYLATYRELLRRTKDT